MVEKKKTKRPASIVEALAGKRLFLTGVTGFLGQVVLERLLLDFPQTQVSVLVRGQTATSAPFLSPSA